MRLGFVLHSPLILIALCGASASFPARAEVEDLIRVTCIPQSNYFDIEDVQIDSEVLNAPDFDSSVWAKFGFHPTNMRDECDLPGNQYVVTSAQPAPGPGECGEAQNITLGLTDNGTALVKDVTFGLTCTGDPSVISISIEDGWLRAGITGGGEAPNSDYTLPGWVRGNAALPITQDKIESCRKKISHHTYLCVVKPAR